MPSFKKTSFSLATLLLFTALVASMVSNYMLRDERVSLIGKNEKMASELSYFDVVDKTKVHAIMQDDPFKMAWQFRVYIPPGKTMKLNYAIGQFGEADLPTPMQTFGEQIEGSDELQTIAIQVFRRGQSDNVVNARINGDFAHAVIYDGVETFSWLEQIEEFSNVIFQPDKAARQLKISSADSPMTIYVMSESQLAEKPSFQWKVSDPPARFKIWLEPVK